ncbi:MAG: hypothetical protein ACFFDF_03585 [Candidatus Odinarchaeota archaeon]
MNISIYKKTITMIIVLWCLIAGPFIMIGVYANPTPLVKPTFSWQKTTFSFSLQKIFVNDTQEISNTGSFMDNYIVREYNYSKTGDHLIKAIHTVDLEANFSTYSKTILSGNYTIDITLDVYRVNINYGTGVKFYWFAVTQGTYELNYYTTYYFNNYSYFEENTRYIESTYYNISLPGWIVTDTWVGTPQTIYDEINNTNLEEVTKGDSPYLEHLYEYNEMSTPLFLTVQVYTTEKKDKIAWANLFNDFIIYKDLDKNMIYSCGDEHTGIPASLMYSTEYFGFMRPIAEDHYWCYKYAPWNTTAIIDFTNPYDTTIDEIASNIVFTPPTAVSDTGISWGIDFPNFPLRVESMELNYFTPLNATYQETTPTSFSYDFDYILAENQADFDVTWEIGKITNETLHEVIKDCGIVMPQFNYFLGSFDLAEVNQTALSFPTETFSFESNDTIVAEINMEKPGKENYTVYDYFGTDANFESRGGSIHPNIIAFNTRGASLDIPLNNLLFSLGDFTSLDPEFTVADDLFRIETQNYPIWGGEHMSHDPSLSIFYTPQTLDGLGGISGYNLYLFIGIVCVISVIMVKRKKKF